MAERSPHFGRRGWIAAHGDTARRAPRRIAHTPDRPAVRSVNHCPMCGQRVRWDTDRRGRTVVLESNKIHICELDRVLEHSTDAGAETLVTLRRAINERRIYGEAV